MIHEILVTPTKDAVCEIHEVYNSAEQRRVSLIFKSDQPIDVHDGYHTLEELYNHRHALFIALLKVLDSYVTPLNVPFARCWKSKLHEDGAMFEGFFIAGISINKVAFTVPIETQHIAYHLPIEYWDLVATMELEKAPPFDGYTPDDVIRRLLAL